MSCEKYNEFIELVLELFGITVLQSSGDIQGARVYSVMRPPIVVPFAELLDEDGRKAIVDKLKEHSEISVKLNFPKKD